MLTASRGAVALDFLPGRNSLFATKLRVGTSRTAFCRGASHVSPSKILMDENDRQGISGRDGKASIYFGRGGVSELDFELV